MNAEDRSLLKALERSQQQGFLGTSDLQTHLQYARTVTTDAITLISGDGSSAHCNAANPI